MTNKTFYHRLLCLFLLMPTMTPFSEQGFADWPEKRDLASAPPDFQKRGKEIQDGIKKNGGFAIAGQAVEKNGRPMKKGTFAVMFNDKKVDCFENGWFIVRCWDQIDSGTLTVATFQHNRIELPVQLEAGKIRFQQIFLEPASKASQATVRGRVLNENGQPVDGVWVALELDFRTNIRAKADSNGVYFFSGITSQPYNLRVTTQNYSSPVQPSAPHKFFSNSSASFKVRARDNKTNLVLEESQDGLSRQTPEGIVTKVLLPRIVKIDAVYQPDGSTDFTKRNVVRNQYGLSLLGNEWIVNGQRMLRDRVAFDPVYAFKDSPGDLTVEVKDGKYSFHPTSGFYALGRGDFNAVEKADPSKIQRDNAPCELNHVYVVRTREGCYAKFIVSSIEVLDPRKAVSVRFVR